MRNDNNINSSKKPDNVVKTPILRKVLSKIFYAFLVPAISISILLSVFFKITEEKYAKETLTTVIATSFSQKGIDDETEIIELKKEMDILNVDSLEPIEGLSLTINRRDIEELSPRDLRLKFFSKISDILYYQDDEEMEKIVTDPKMRENIKDAGFITLISKEGHKKLEEWFLYAILVVILSGSGVYTMNKGLSRFTMPAKAAIFASIPGLIIILGIKLFISSESGVSLSDDNNFTQIFANIVKNALPQTIDLFFRTYLWIFILGSSIYLGCKIYIFWKKLFKKNNTA
jgi:hypothetical protein